MSKDVNVCTFIGRLGKPVEQRAMPNGKAVANFSIACGDDYKDKNGANVEQTNWINIVAFDKLAEICGKYLDKGSKVYISGKFVTRKWQDNTGADRYSTEIIANNMQMLDGKPENGSQQQSAQPVQQQAPQQQAGGFDDFDEPPF